MRIALEEVGLTVLEAVLLLDFTGDMPTLEDEALRELSHEEADLGGFLVAEEGFEDSAGLGSVLLEPPKLCIFDTGVALRGTEAFFALSFSISTCLAPKEALFSGTDGMVLGLAITFGAFGRDEVKPPFRVMGCVPCELPEPCFVNFPGPCTPMVCFLEGGFDFNIFLEARSTFKADVTLLELLTLDALLDF